MFWKIRCTERILIALPDNLEEQYKYKSAIFKYLEEYHSDDLNKGRISYGTLYTHPIVTVEIQLYNNYELDIFELHKYIAEHAKSTDTIVKGE